MPRPLLEIAMAAIESGQARLPVFDASGARAQQMIAAGNFDVDALEAIAGNDPSLASALLRAANSSFYGGLEKIVTLRDAVVRIGARKSCQLIVVLGQKEVHHMRDPRVQRVAESLWRHSLACALGCDWLVRRLHLSHLDSEAMLAGLLHDVGKLFLSSVIDDVIASDPSEFDPSEDLLREITRSLHCEQGERLLAAWRIPEPYGRIARHHHDEDVDENDTLLLVVRLVDQVCNRLGIGPEPRPGADIATTLEAQLLRTSEVLLAELEIQIEDAIAIDH